MSRDRKDYEINCYRASLMRGWWVVYFRHPNWNDNYPNYCSWMVPGTVTAEMFD